MTKTHATDINGCDALTLVTHLAGEFERRPISAQLDSHVQVILYAVVPPAAPLQNLLG